MRKKRRGWAVRVEGYSYSRKGKIVKVTGYKRRKPKRG